MRRAVGLMIVLFFAVVAVGGLRLGMEMGSDGRMTDCAFGFEYRSEHGMSGWEHLSAWEGLFAAGTSRFLLLCLLALSCSWLLCKAGPFLRSAVLRIYPLKVYGRWKRLHKLFEPLLLEFSQGILHSRIYA